MNDFLRRLLGLPEEASSAAAAIDHLHLIIIFITMLGATAVGLIAVAFAVRYRQVPGKPSRAVAASPMLEVIIISALTLLFAIFWWFGFIQYQRLQQPPADAMDVYVSAKQWMWKFAYPDGKRSISVLVVPVGRPVRLLMTSRDVIHSFYVPAFRIKHDVVPGMVSTVWFQVVHQGSYQILCSQYCGTSHAQMRGTVVALMPHDFSEWLAGRTPRALSIARAEEVKERRIFADDRSAFTSTGADDPDEVLPRNDSLVAQGRIAAARHGCFSCHTSDGQTHIGPTWLGLFGSTVHLTDGRSIIADEEYMTRSMMDPNADIVSGFQPVMPSYRGLIDNMDTASIIEYIRSLKDNVPDPLAPHLPPIVNPPLPHIPPIPVETHRD